MRKCVRVMFTLFSGLSASFTTLAYFQVSKAQKLIAQLYAKGLGPEFTTLEHIKHYLEREMEAPEVIINYVIDMERMLKNSYNFLESSKPWIAVSALAFAGFTLYNIVKYKKGE